MKVLLDTNVLPADNLVLLLKKNGYEIFVGQATAHREIKGTDLNRSVNGMKIARETFLFDEGTFPIRFSENADRLEKILGIISTNSFPKN